MKKLLLLLSLFLFAVLLPARAQTDTICFNVRILDSFTREPLVWPNVAICETDSVTELQKLLYRGNLCYYSFVPRRAVYVLKVGKEGYKPQCVRIVVPQRKRRAKEFYADDVLLQKDFGKDEHELGEATVTASRIAMIVKGDTIEYDARAFRLAEGSMLDNLLAMMPGFELTPDGRIFNNGEYVSRLMVNGRDLFKGNPKIALDNLPAYTVDKVKVFHEGPEWEHLVDERNPDNTQHPLVVDVRLKREYAQGWIANFEAAEGTKTRGAWDNVYLARLFGMRYTDHSGLSLYASVNNLGDNQRPGSKGDWKRLAAGQGDCTVKAGGVSLDINGRRTGTKLNTSLDVKRSDVRSATQTTSQTGEGLVQQLMRSDRASHSGDTRVGWQASISAKSRYTYFKFDPSVSYSHSRTTDAERTRQQTAATPDEPVVWEDGYTRSVDLLTRGDSWTAGIKANAQLKSPLSGKLYYVSADFGYGHTTRHSDRRDIVRYVRGGTDADHLWRDALPSEHYSYKVEVSRNVLYVKKGLLSVDLGYFYNQTYSSGARRRDEWTAPDSALAGLSVPAALPSVTADGAWQADLANTYRTGEWNRNHNVKATVHMQSSTFRFWSNIYATYTRRNIADLRSGEQRSLGRRDFSVNIYNNFNITPLHLSVDYYYMAFLPPLSSMLDVRDSANPLYVQLGNPGLKRSARHYAAVVYHRYFKKHQRNIRASVSGDFRLRDVGYAREFDAATGVTTTRPRNINGNKSGRLDLSYGQALDRAGRLMLSSGATLRLDHSVDFAGDATTGGSLRSVVDNYVASGNLGLSYRTTGGLSVGANGSYTYTDQRARPLTYRSNDASEFTCGLTFTAPFAKHFGVETDLTVYGRRGYSEASMNTTDWVWNASVSYTFGRGGAWLVRAVGCDLLRQISNIRRVMTAQGYTETRYSSVPSYASLHLVYRLHLAPKRKKP